MVISAHPLHANDTSSLLLGRKIPEPWRASYAWSRERGGPGLTVRRFRRRFILDRRPDFFPVYVSADSRYRLWVNGQPMGRGPLKGTLEHYHYAVYDLAPSLVKGENLLAAEVRWFGEDAPESEIHGSVPGFLFQAENFQELDTPGSWKVFADHSITADTTSYISNALGFLGHMERMDGRLLPKGWVDPGFDDSAWGSAVSTGPADSGRPWGVFPVRDLHTREIPLLVEVPQRFQRTIQNKHVISHLFGESPQGWSLGEGEAGEVVLDAGHLTTGYPRLRFVGGAGRTVEVIYGEAIVKPSANPWENREKAVRDDLSFGDVDGYQDTVILPGGEFEFEPFHWRTFWFIKVRVSAGDTTFTLKDASFKFTTYPQQLQAEFESSDPDSQKMWEVSWRTLQNNAHETYEDCPYYEQHNYVADSRLEALGSLALAGETRLPRRTIRLFRDSVRPDGLVHSRVPSTHRQILPYFSLLWVLMVEDYWQWVGSQDAAFVRSCLQVVDGVLWFFRERLREDGFVGKVPKWNMVDRCEGWEGGEPPAVRDGESTYLTCLYIRALDAAVKLHRETGEPADATRWLSLADRLREAVRTRAWSEKEGLFLEGPGRTRDRLSQHSQALAILSGAATPEQGQKILKRLTTDSSLHQTKYMQSYYLARALEKAGGYAAFPGPVLAPWREMLRKHLSTWAEYPDPGRSDCHAWSSWIAVDFLTCVLGVQPAKPGFQEILIRPQTEAVSWAKGAMPTVVGTIRVDWRKDPETGKISLKAETPAGIPVRVELPGLAPKVFTTGGKISL